MKKLVKAKEDLPEKMILKPRPKGNERWSHVNIQGNRRQKKWQVQRP